MHRFSFQEEQQLDPQKNMISVNKGQITAVKRSRSVHSSVSPSSERGANARNVNLTYLLTMEIWRFSTSLISSFLVSLLHQYGTTVSFYFASTTGKNWSSSSFLIEDFFDLLLSSETRQLQGVNISSFGAAEQTNSSRHAHQWSKQKWSERAIALTLWSSPVVRTFPESSLTQNNLYREIFLGRLPFVKAGGRPDRQVLKYNA